MRKALTGLRAWMIQRLSAVFMLGFLVFLLAHFVFDPPRSYAAWRGWMLSPSVSVSATVFFAALLAHAWVGLRDVILDYVGPVAVRVFVLAVLALGLAALGAWFIGLMWSGRG